MIPATELHHGCWYSFDRYGEGRLWINDDYTFYIEFPNQSNEMLSRFSYSQINPIPLSPEILLACGFKEAQEVKQYYSLYLSERFYLAKNPTGFYISIQAEPDGYGDNEECWTKLDIHSLHQLMNLYHSLTGRELVYSQK